MTTEVVTCHGQFPNGCGATVVEYQHRLNKALVLGLRRLERVGGGPINLSELGLTRNQWDNFQKLRYFDLVEQVEVDGLRKRGVWRITDIGRAFIEGRASVRASVWTFRGERTLWGDAPITVEAVLGVGYQQRPEWAAEAIPHE